MLHLVLLPEWRHSINWRWLLLWYLCRPTHPPTYPHYMLYEVACLWQTQPGKCASLCMPYHKIRLWVNNFIWLFWITAEGGWRLYKWNNINCFGSILLIIRNVLKLEIPGLMLGIYKGIYRDIISLLKMLFYFSPNSSAYIKFFFNFVSNYGCVNLILPPEKLASASLKMS